ncbi:MAG: PQQ-dependent sugar dehydrogenase, partial [Polaromonas sp.]|nr:PQQ-dependent sugar dehydrogenase [Polaromonas sp.]
MPSAQYLHRLLAPVLIAVCLSALASQPAQSQAVQPQTVVAGLENPWGVAFLPDGRFLVTERPGRMRLITGGKASPPLSGVPPVAAGGQGGLLDVLADSDFARNRTLYFCYSEPAASGSGNSTALAHATLSADDTRLENLKVIFSQKPKFASTAHFGCRIVESRSGGNAD